MIGENDAFYAEERRKDMLREAEHDRLVRLARPARPRRARFYGRALAWMGRQLIAWGRRLQERYGAPAATPPIPSPQSPRYETY